MQCGDTFYGNVQPEDCEELVKEHVLGGKPVERLFAAELNVRNEPRGKEGRHRFLQGANEDRPAQLR